MLKEFKEFALKGNALELAIGVIIGGAFQKIVSSLVEDLIMPLLSLICGNMDFSNWVLKIGNSTITYGNFISAVINFLLVAFVLFLVIKNINKLNAKIEEAKQEQAKKLQELAKSSKLLGKLKKDKKEEQTEEVNTNEPEPTVKLCPYCFTEIHYQATRCPHCTSQLEEE